MPPPGQTVEKSLGGIGGPQLSDFGSETGGVYVGFGCLAQQGFPYALCRPASRRRVGKERFPSEKIAFRRAFLTACPRGGVCPSPGFFAFPQQILLDSCYNKQNPVEVPG